MNVKKLLVGLPFILTIFIVLFVTNIIYREYVIKNYNEGETFKSIFFGITHSILVTLLLWSVFKCCLTNPGYVKNAIYVTEDNSGGQNFQVNQQSDNLSSINQESKPSINHLIDPTDDRNLLVFAKQPLLENQRQEDTDLETQLLPNNFIQKVNLKEAKLLGAKKKCEGFEDKRIHELKQLTEFRYCDLCNQLKPPRAHHCSICQQCVMRMDHHCPWVGNCVGLNNHKFFILFLFYTSIASFQVFLLMLFNREEGQSLSQHFMQMQKDSPVMITFSLSISFACATAGMLGFHIYLILKNNSTIELDKLQGWNVYNQGHKNNWAQVFGENWMTWLIPVEPKRTVNGIHYPMRSEMLFWNKEENQNQL